MSGVSGSRSVSNVMRLAAIAGLTVSTAARRTSATLIARASSRSLPLIARAHVEQIVDEAGLRVRVPLDGRDRARLLRRLQRLGAEDARPPVDRRERRAQLVRHRHQELVFQVARGLGLFPRAPLAIQRGLEALVRVTQVHRFLLLHRGGLALGAGARVDDGRAPSPSPRASA